jgi:nickel/cobalt exporter
MLTDLFQQGTAHAWLYLPSAIVLGALHGLEPGHSKTMMAAFIIAVRGTVGQAVLLGICATLSHTLIVWVIALGGMYFWQGVDAEKLEPYLQVVSAVLIVGIALWMLFRTYRERSASAHGHAHGHAHAHDHGHGHDHGHTHAAPRLFDVGHAHAHDHDHRNGHDRPAGLDLSSDAQDAHALAHADDIRRRFANRNVTTGQIVMFGLTGGLIPCGAAVTVLLLCLQVGAFLLGVVLVLCFSIGLALTLVAVGAAAALGVQHAAKRVSWLGSVAATAPYLSSVLILVIGLYVGYEGFAALATRIAA